MGRYPWTHCTQEYLNAVEQYYSPSTLSVTRRALRIIGVALGELKESGRIASTNPKKLSMSDIEAFLAWMKERRTRDGKGLAMATQANYLGYLGNFLRWVENPVMDKMKTLHHVRLPQKLSAEVRVLSENTVREIMAGLESMPGWYGSVARLITAMYPYSGLRRSELRRARLQDLDTERWTIYVAHPKGELRWAYPQSAPILQPARKAVADYLVERREYLADCGVSECEPLVPVAYSNGRMEYWSDGMWTKAKADVVKWTGIPFRIQELRATFAQVCKDRGASIEAVSRALRHRTTRTTELYYARIKPDDAFRELEQVFSDFDEIET